MQNTQPPAQAYEDDEIDLRQLVSTLWAQKGLIAGVGVLGAALAARLPEARPLLAALCEPIGCALEPPRQIDLIEIESSDLTPDPQTPGHLQLVATLRNKASFAQAWPHLELTLTDVSDRALLRRALAPAEYLPATAPAKDGFVAGGDRVVHLDLHAADTPAVGYRLYLFYP